MSTTIEFTTPRLVIRTPDENDAKDIFALMSDEQTAADTGFPPMTDRSEAEGKIRSSRAAQSLFVIAEACSPSRAIGVFEFFHSEADTLSGRKNSCEICYFLDKGARRKGYMTEVMETMKPYLFDERKADLLIIAIHPRNDASRRVALKSGFTYDCLEKKSGVTCRNELVDLEYYTLYREEYLSPGTKVVKERLKIIEKQKWINEGGILYPIPGYATLLPSPGNGIFRIYEDSRTRRLGLEKIDTAFIFDFKVYDLGCEDVMSKIMKAWNSELFSSSGKNLGVIFNGLKGTGKTIAAKLLANRTGLPVVIISKPLEGLLDFIQSLCFESVLLIDEAEKTFQDNQEVLLKMIDGVYNNRRKLYILTTNRLSVDENLLGRPGRIRYIKEFGNLSAKAVNDIIDDNLADLSMKPEILGLIDKLEISTIDILKSIIDECNIMQQVPSDSMLNVPKAKYKLKTMVFEKLDSDLFQEIKTFIVDNCHEAQSVEEWLMQILGHTEDGSPKRNKDMVEERFGCSIEIEVHPSSSPILYQGQYFKYGTVVSAPDAYGFFTLESNWDHTDELCCMSHRIDAPSLYKGLLF